MTRRTSIAGVVAAFAGAAVLIAGASRSGAAPAAGDDVPTAVPSTVALATFAGGCFWCMEPPFDEVEGVLSTTSGYTGGKVRNPTYEEVSAGGTGHAEALRVEYDPAKVSYRELLDVFWRNIDPLVENRQFCDVGEQYRSAIFYHDEEQRRLAEETKRGIEASGRFDRPVATEIVPAGEFWPAEEYHQDYYRKNPIRYKFYSFNCGRERRLRELWGERSG
ncbi:MAG TPA: peptide-methionine (S)-S-oxide reductase MsrA [Gemmatimonadota bacterium]